MEPEENLNILIVDDEPSIHDSIREILTYTSEPKDSEISRLTAEVFQDSVSDLSDVKRLKYKVDSAFQGEEALQKVIAAKERSNPYAMIVVDVRMPPGWDGLRTVDEIWKVAPNTEIVVASAYSDHSWSDFTKAFGYPDRLLILRKPFHAVELQQMAHTLVRKWNDANQLRRVLNAS